MNYRRWLLLFTTWFFFAILFLRTAWLCDDAYITFRVVDNFVNGYGLRWNVNERVQTYTHPLWLFIHILFYALTREMYLIPIAISFSISLLTIILITLFHTKNTAQLLLIICTLGLSRSFNDYSSSGLENPLSHLLLTLFYFLFFRIEFTPTQLFLLSLLTSLSALNRLDTILFYIPPLMYAWFHTHDKKRGILCFIIGFLPLIAWEIFSLIYYGFPFPNTYYAKLCTGIPRIDLIKQGLRYYQWLIQHDLITFSVISCSSLLLLRFPSPYLYPAFAGLLLYCLYVLWIGGDFMGGRFFSISMLASAIFFLHYNLWENKKQVIYTLILFTSLGLIQPHQTILPDSIHKTTYKVILGPHAINNERLFYFPHTNLSQWCSKCPMPCMEWADRGRLYRQWNQPLTRVCGSVGFIGFFSGPQVHIIDFLAITDPLLARLPAYYNPRFAIGHFERIVPQGYFKTAGGNENHIADEGIKQFYEHLKIITRGPIWSWERWKTIVNMNLGKYNYLIDYDKWRYAGTKKLTYKEFMDEMNTLSRNAGIFLYRLGMEISWDQTQFANSIRAELMKGKKYHFLFFHDRQYLGRTIIRAPIGNQARFVEHSITIPRKAQKLGFNKIRIYYCPDTMHTIKSTYLRSIYLNTTSPSTPSTSSASSDLSDASDLSDPSDSYPTVEPIPITSL